MLETWVCEMPSLCYVLCFTAISVSRVSGVANETRRRSNKGIGLLRCVIKVTSSLKASTCPLFLSVGAGALPWCRDSGIQLR